MATTQKQRIRGWMMFDWAQQPFYTLGLTFVFGPYFAGVAADVFMSEGLDKEAADAQAQSVWLLAQTIAGLFIAVSAPVLGAYADNSGKKKPWIILFSVIYVICSTSLWYLYPDGRNLYLMLIVFYIGFIASESALNFVNAILPSLGTDKEVGRISGSAASLGYWGGVVALFIMAAFFVEFGDDGSTIAGLQPILGLDPSQKEGTRAGGPFIALWFIVFIVPFLIWVKDTPVAAADKISVGQALSSLANTLKAVYKRKSLFNFLVAGMFYRDGLNALYATGGVYARLVLGWSIGNIIIFGIISAVMAAVVTYIGGRADQRFGPKPVIKTAIFVLMAVSTLIVLMNRETILFIPIAEGSQLPDIIFFVCGACIGGAGGVLYSASRSMMVRHTDDERPTEAFGLFALSGKATAFLAPALITVFTFVTGNTQLGFIPVILLFILGLFLLRYVNAEGDQTA